MRLILHRDEPIEEIAAEPSTLARFAELLDHARRSPTAVGPVLGGGRGLLALPRVVDHDVPPLTVLLRPCSALAERTAS
jgi:hypothetical protein